MQQFVNLCGFKKQDILIEDTIQAISLVQTVLSWHCIEEKYCDLFQVQISSGIILEIDDILHFDYVNETTSIKIVPVHFEKIVEDYSLPLIFSIFSYCTQQYLTNSWNYTEMNVLIICLQLQQIHNQSELTFLDFFRLNQTPQNPRCKQVKLLKPTVPSPEAMTNTSYALLPERQRAIQRRVATHLRNMEVMFFDEFIALPFQSKIKTCIEQLLKSAYHHFLLYPVLDIGIDWTSLIGVARDGICLIDGEIGVGYIYLPFALFDYIHDAQTLTIKPKRLQAVEQSVVPELSDDETAIKSPGAFTKLTKKISLPMYPKIPKNEVEEEDLKKLASYKVNQAELTVRRQSELSGQQLQSVEKSSIREQIQLKFASENHLENFVKNLIRYGKNPVLYNDRFLRIQSKTQVELFQSLYLNNLQIFCSIPAAQLMQQIDTILDIYYFKHKVVELTEVVFPNEPMHIMSVRAVVSALTGALNYNPQSHKVKVTVGDKIVYYSAGEGTPYDPFVPQNQEIHKNLILQILRFDNNSFESQTYVPELCQLFKCKLIKDNLKELVLERNIIKQNAAILLADRLKGVHNLEVLQLNFGKISSIGTSCMMYLLNFNKNYVKELGIAGSHLVTKNQVIQLSLYLKGCIQKWGKIEMLNITECLTQKSHAQTLYEQMREMPKIGIIVARQCDIDVAAILRSLTDRLEV